MSTIPRYVFRGTTINFNGGSSSKKYKYTCTTRHPAKAVLFALECAQFYPDNSVVYIANTEKFAHLTHTDNLLKKIEEEFIWPISPMEFCTLSEGYEFVPNMQKVLEKFGFNTYEIVRSDNLNRLCREMKGVSDKQLEGIITELLSSVKK